MSAEPDRSHQKPPFLKRVRIRNYKSIKFCDVELEPLTVLVGRNGSGKSNFVDALGFLRNVLRWNLTEAVSERGGRHYISRRNSDDHRIAFDLDLYIPSEDDPETRDRFRYQLVIETPPEAMKPTRIIEEKAERFSESGKVIDRFIATVPNGRTRVEWGEFYSPGRAIEIASQYPRPALSNMSDRVFGRLYLALESLAVYDFQPPLLRKARSPEPGGLLLWDGGNLVDAVITLGQTDPWALSRISAYLRAITGYIDFYQVGQNAYNIDQLLLFRAHLESGRSGSGTKDHFETFPAASLSDGTLRAFATLVAAFQTTSQGPPSLVAIEEPETSLHPAATAALVDALDEATGRTQVLITTHSTELLDNETIQPKNVRVVEMIDGETVITGVDEATEEIYRERFDTLGGLERQNQLHTNFADRERQKLLAAEAAPQ